MPAQTGLQSPWSFESPVALWAQPSTDAATAESLAWNATTRTLVMIVATNDISAGVPQVISITNVRTPSSIVNSSNAKLTSKDD